MALRLLSMTLPLFALLALACGGGSDSPGATPTPPAPTLAPKLEGFSITLERTSCFGTCPEYSVTVRGDGSVTYHGEQYVAATGEQTASIPIDDVQRLVEKIDEIDYFGLRDEYPCFATYITSVTLHERAKTIRACSGGDGRFSDTPRELRGVRPASCAGWKT